MPALASPPQQSTPTHQNVGPIYRLRGSERCPSRSTLCDPFREVVRFRDLAPAWHATVEALAPLGFSVLGARVRLPAIVGIGGRIPSYFLAMVFEWVVVACIWWGRAAGASDCSI